MHISPDKLRDCILLGCRTQKTSRVYSEQFRTARMAKNQGISKV